MDIIPTLSIIPALARSQDDVLRGIRENVGATMDLTAVFAVLAGFAAFVILLAGLQFLRRRAATPRVVHSLERLQHDLVKATGLSRSDLQQLNTISRKQKLSSPLLLILCPSLLEKAMEEED